MLNATDHSSYGMHVLNGNSISVHSQQDAHRLHHELLRVYYALKRAEHIAMACAGFAMD